MSTFSHFQESSQTAALEIVRTSPETITDLQTCFATHFGGTTTLSAVRAQYAALDLASTRPEQHALSTAMTETTAAVDTVLQDIATLTHFITLTIPKMEDGNNFGVTVQLAALKYMADTQEKLVKGLDEISKYHASRADALEKCKLLPSASKSVTVTKTQSDTSGNTTEKGDAVSTETKTVQEEKQTSTAVVDAGAESEYRKQAVLDVDVLFYTKTKALLQAAVTGYVMAVDFLEKNQEKITEPKGKKGSGSVFHSMY